MTIKRLKLLILVLLLGLQACGFWRNPSAGAKVGTPAEAGSDAQLQLYKEALINKGSSEQMRTNAAKLLLFSENPEAREILINVLSQRKDNACRAAVCQNLIRAEEGEKTVENRQDFISPLFEILKTEQDFALAKLAGEALLLFRYEQVSEPLEKLSVDVSLPVQARFNGIYALKLQPDKRAAIKLVELLDDPEEQVAAESHKALKFLGIAAPTEPAARNKLIKVLQQKEQKEFLRLRLIQQTTRMRRLEDEVGWWQQQYLEALSQVYQHIEDNTARGKFLAGHLVSSKIIVKLWAMEKVSQWRHGTHPKLPEEVGPILVGLISDPDRQVRLKTAELLAVMGELNSAQKLLTQLSVEQDEKVRIKLFVALGASVNYALLPNAGYKISPQVKQETLKWSVSYLSQTDHEQVREGAEVIKKILEQNGLTTAEAGQYLELLAKRYRQEKDKADGSLRGELLGKLAGLCAQGSACRTKAAKVFSPLFEQGLNDKTDLVRETAVDGIIYIGKENALNRFRKTELINDPSIKIRVKLVNLAGEVGGKADLSWLWEKVGASADGSSAWEAVLKIFRRCDASVLSDWMGKLTRTEPDNKLTDEQQLAFLEVAEQKAGGAENAQMLKNIQTKLAQLYKKSGKFKLAADYFGRLYERAETAEQKASILPKLLDAYLRWPNAEGAANLIDNCLLEKDLDPNSAVVLTVEHYLSEPPTGVDPNQVLREMIKKVKPVKDRPAWQKQLRRWSTRIGRIDKSEKPKTAKDGA